MLILAGVSIATLTGENGILTRAQEAKEKTEQAQKDEQNILNSYEDQLNAYAGIDWDTVLANAQKHPDQKTSTAIGVGTDGRAVNMDLWEFTLIEDGTYALNDSDSVAPTGTRTAGYTGRIIDGKIEGTMPQYIKNENNDEFIAVTNLMNLFKDNGEIETMPEIPSTIISMEATFSGCSKLKNLSKIPENVISLHETFSNCTSLTTMPEIPNKVTDMTSTFFNCTSLKTLTNIPDSVQTLAYTFYNCASITAMPESIGNSVTDMEGTFSNCTSLKKISKLPGNLESMQKTFTNCTQLEESPNIPDTVTDMQQTFYGCSNLVKGPNIIPNSVNIMYFTFANCVSLTGTMEINASVTGATLPELNNSLDYEQVFQNTSTKEGTELFITGTCELLDELILTKSYNSNISKI